MGDSLKHIYITAPSIISSLGFSIEENRTHIRNYQSGLRLIHNKNIQDSSFVAAPIGREGLKATAASEGLESFTTLEQLFILNLRETIRKSGVDPKRKDCCLIFSTTKGNIDRLSKDNFPSEVLLAEFGKRIGEALECVNTPIIISNACISGVSALIVAQRMLATRQYKHALVAGGDLMNKFVITGFESFKSISASGCRPFDADRDGLSLGEACGSVLLTSVVDVVNDDKPIVVEGGAITNDANHISGPSRTGDGLYLAISKAMEEAKITSKDVSFLNLHGTGTVYNDEMEAKAIDWAELQEVPLNSLKSYWGHTLGASGVIETIICMEQLCSGEVFGTLGYQTNGVSRQLNVSSKHRQIEAKRCIKVASGFGGCNAALILAKKEYANETALLTPASYRIKKRVDIINREILVDNQSMFSLKGGDFPEFIRAAYKSLNLDDRKFYKMDDLCKLGYIATTYLLENAPLIKTYKPDEIALVFANAASSLDSDIQHQRNISDEDGGEASPAVFVYTLPNVVLGEICIRHKIKGENTFFIQEKYDEQSLMHYASLVLNTSTIKACVVGWCELLGDKYEAHLNLLEKIN